MTDRLAQALRASLTASDVFQVADACKLTSGVLGETERYLLAFGFLLSLPPKLRAEVCQVALTGSKWLERDPLAELAPDGELLRDARNWAAIAHEKQRKALLVALCEELTDEGRVALRKWLAGVR